MELEKIETKEEKALGFMQQENLFMKIIQGQDVTEVVKTSYGDFKIKFPRMVDIETIGKLTAYRLNGINATSFDSDTYNLINHIATLDVLVISGPAWYENAKKEQVNFGFGKMPDQKIVEELYAKAYEFRNKVQSELEKNNGNTNKRMAVNKDDEVNSQSGVFEGLSS